MLKKIKAYQIFQWLNYIVAFLFPLTKKYLPGILVLAGIVGLISMKPKFKKGPVLVLGAMLIFY